MNNEQNISIEHVSFFIEEPDVKDVINTDILKQLCGNDTTALQMVDEVGR